MRENNNQLRARIAELTAALRPFAAMHRLGCDPKELAAKRGIQSDATFLFSHDFEAAAKALGWYGPDEEPMPPPEPRS